MGKRFLTGFPKCPQPANQSTREVANLHCTPKSVDHNGLEYDLFHIFSPPLFDASPRDCYYQIAGWSSLVARWAHNPKVASSNLAPATNRFNGLRVLS